MTTVKNFVPPQQWGKDHLSTLAYIGYVIVHCNGIPDNNRMRTDADLNPALVGPLLARETGMVRKKYPTRLAGGLERANHDDWSCLEDMEEAGLLKWEGTGINPLFVFTDIGWKVHAELEKHVAAKLPCAQFDICKILGIATGDTGLVISSAIKAAAAHESKNSKLPAQGGAPTSAPA